MTNEQVQTGLYFPVIHRLPFLADLPGCAEGAFPVAESLAARTLAIPFYTRITEDEQARVVEALSTSLGRIAS